jgi:hypothetical protein
LSIVKKSTSLVYSSPLLYSGTLSFILPENKNNHSHAASCKPCGSCAVTSIVRMSLHKDTSAFRKTIKNQFCENKI